jgi:hypothetical protein
MGSETPMQALLDDPMLQSAFAPLVVALLVGAALARTRLAWFAIGAALATAAGLSTGIGFTPMSASRKLLLLVLLAPFAGLAFDLLPRPPHNAASATTAPRRSGSSGAYWRSARRRRCWRWPAAWPCSSARWSR